MSNDNLVSVFDSVPKTKQLRNCRVSLMIKWSPKEEHWIVGYGAKNVIEDKDPQACGRGETLLEAIVDLNKILN